MGKRVIHPKTKRTDWVLPQFAIDQITKHQNAQFTLSRSLRKVPFRNGRDFVRIELNFIVILLLYLLAAFFFLSFFFVLFLCFFPFSFSNDIFGLNLWRPPLIDNVEGNFAWLAISLDIPIYVLSWLSLLKRGDVMKILMSDESERMWTFTAARLPK